MVAVSGVIDHKKKGERHFRRSVLAKPPHCVAQHQPHLDNCLFKTQPTQQTKWSNKMVKINAKSSRSADSSRCCSSCGLASSCWTATPSFSPQKRRSSSCRRCKHSTSRQLRTFKPRWRSAGRCSKPKTLQQQASVSLCVCVHVCMQARALACWTTTLTPPLRPPSPPPPLCRLPLYPSSTHHPHALIYTPPITAASQAGQQDDDPAAVAELQARIAHLQTQLASKNAAIKQVIDKLRGLIDAFNMWESHKKHLTQQAVQYAAAGAGSLL